MPYHLVITISMHLSAGVRGGKKKETPCIRERMKVPVLSETTKRDSMQIFYFILISFLFGFTACKPVPKDSLTLLYTSDMTGQIEPCG
jgi:hypothetical protein